MIKLTFRINSKFNGHYYIHEKVVQWCYFLHTHNIVRYFHSKDLGGNGAGDVGVGGGVRAVAIAAAAFTIIVSWLVFFSELLRVANLRLIITIPEGFEIIGVFIIPLVSSAIKPVLASV